ncbi:MAG: bifunctional metallophosphatase/5'-nucleotidase [Polyangiaceae bacterium]|nr:bifunctional metallophosphatase/5'-nucleotidase [Polyangiaceae bacterium]MCW5789214.1 bifunctional metallophosphatase/5'-nucleotidase [Polyangiaceae bacterium]
MTDEARGAPPAASKRAQREPLGNVEQNGARRPRPQGAATDAELPPPPRGFLGVGDRHRGAARCRLALRTPGARKTGASKPRPRAPLLPALLLVTACGATSPGAETPSAEAPAPSPSPAASVRLTIVGTNDMHGAVTRLPLLSAYLTNLRAELGGAGGLVLVDAGDIFQGSLESNTGEGDVMIQAMNQLGFAAAAVGNHEFDFGPLGPPHAELNSDPQGALRARLAEARFPFLAANLTTSAGELPSWDNLHRSALIEVAGVKVGLVGLATPQTSHIVLPAYVAGLEFTDPRAALEQEARALRAAGASVVVVTGHLGGSCTELTDPHALASCDPKEEVMEVVSGLPPGLVDVFVGGHTHKAIAHEVSGVAVVESYSKLRAFSRVDLTLEVARTSASQRVAERRIFPPQALCDDASDALETCTGTEYAGRPLTPDPAMQALIAPALERAREARERAIGVTLSAPAERAYDEPSALGDLFADLTLAAGRRGKTGKRGADVAVANGGGLRADLPAGPLRYGALFSAMPFDNRLGYVRLTGAQLSQVLAAHLGREQGGVLSIAGLRTQARCQAGQLTVTLTRPNGAAVKGTETLWLVTSDYLATGGDGLLSPIELTEDAVQLAPGALLRDRFAEELAALGARGPLDPSLKAGAAPRLDGADRRPVRCD